MGVAVISATVASASVYRAVSRQSARSMAEPPSNYIVIAAHPLPLGTRIGAADVKRVAWPESAPIPDAYAKAEDVVGRGIIAPVAANEPITTSKVAPREAGAGLSPAIPHGMRAISVRVNEVIGVAGFAVPGAHVDVIATVRRSGDAMSRVLVANVPVLTAGTRYEQEQRQQEKPNPSATVVTLMVTPEQAERIALASAEGNIVLMLRNPLDESQPDTSAVQLTGLIGDAKPAPAATSGAVRPLRTARAEPPSATPAVATVAAPSVYSYEAIRAGKRTEETIR